MISNATALFDHKALIRELTNSEIRRQNADRKIGWLWWLLDPLIMMLVYSAIVVGLFGRGDRYAPYAIFILCALVPFKHFADSVAKCCSVLRANSGLIKSVPFPTMVIPLSVVLTGFTSFLFGMLVLLLAALIAGRPFNASLIQLPFLMASHLSIVTGTCLVVAALGSILVDLISITGHATRILFFLSPTLYGLDLVFEQIERGANTYPILELLSWIYLLNPFATLLTGYRDAIFYGEFLDLRYWLILAAVSAVILLIGYRIYLHFERRVIKFI